MSEGSDLKTIADKLDNLKTILDGNSKKLNAINEKHLNFEKKMATIESDVVENQTKIKDQEKQIDENQSKIKELDASVSDFKESACKKEEELGTAISDLRRRINRRIIILQGSGLPDYHREEDLRAMFFDLIKDATDCKIDERCVATIHRNRNKKNVFIEFTSTDVMLKMLEIKTRSYLRAKNVYIEKFQTKEDSKIYYVARKMRNKGVIAEARVNSQGITVVRKTSGDVMKKVPSLNILEELSDGRWDEFKNL